MKEEQNNKIKLISILAIDSKNGIGIDNTLPWNVKEEMALFKQKTLNNVVVMGRNTFLSLKKPLVNRVNCILSNNKEFIEQINQLKIEKPQEYKNVLIFNHLNEVIDYCKQNKHEQLFIIGGKQLYESTFHLVDEVHISIFDKDYHCNVFIDFDDNPFNIEEMIIKDEFTHYVFARNI